MCDQQEVLVLSILPCTTSDNKATKTRHYILVSRVRNFSGEVHILDEDLNPYILGYLWPWRTLMESGIRIRIRPGRGVQDLVLPQHE
jgi:hypothetical protein